MRVLWGVYLPDVVVSCHVLWLCCGSGGGQCWDQASCATRGGTYVSSLTFPSSRTVYGILDADPAHTPLWGANKAYLGYCSSDGYMGDVGASDDTWGWAFRGQALVRALVRDLVDTHGLQTARKVYVVGSSAGGRGVMVHLDALVASPMWPATAEVIGFLDSPYYLDIEPYSEDFQGFAYQEQQKYLLFNTTGIIDADCAAVYPTEQWKCQFGQYRMPFVDTPYFLVASMYDAYQLSNNIQTEPAQYDADMLAYATAFGALDREDLSALTAAIIAPDSSRSPLSGKVRGGGRTGDGDGYGYAVYAWACYNHAVAVTSLFYEASSSEGVSQKQAFQEYLSQNPGGAGANTTTATSTTTSASGDFFVLTWMDSCEEFACDVNC